MVFVAHWPCSRSSGPSFLLASSSTASSSASMSLPIVLTLLWHHGLHQHLLPLPFYAFELASRPSLLILYTLINSWGALPSTSSICITSMCLRPRCILEAGNPDAHFVHDRSTTSSSTLTFSLDECLDVPSYSSTVSSHMCHHPYGTSSCTHGFMCG